MTFLLYTAEAVLISLLSYMLWYFIRPSFVKSSLSHIPGPPRKSWLRGNFDQVNNRDGWEFHRGILEKYGNVVKLSGWFGDEQLYVADPRALHNIFIKEQHIYEEVQELISTNVVTFGPSLISTFGETHRKQRKMLNPVFSIKHLRSLVDVFYPIAYKLREVLTRKVVDGEEEINILKWSSLAALEYIGQGGLGYSFDALDETKKNVYSESIKMLFPVGFNLILFRHCLPYLMKIGSPAFRRKLVEWMPSKDLQQAKTMVDIMDAQSREIWAKKKAALAKGDEAVVKQVGQGKDLMSILMQANMAASEKDKLPEEELIGQMNSLIFAGHDTTSGTIARTLHILSLHPDVQGKLREEVTTARKEHGDLDYNLLMNLPYLDAVCRETLRVYPPVPFVSRITRKDVIMPLQSPIKAIDGKRDITEIHLKKNTNLTISILGANLSKAIWGEDSEEWKPERWLNPLPKSVSEAHLPGVYSSIMTFIGGGRACIGFKFAELELKLVLSVMLESFKFSPTNKEIQWNMNGLVQPSLEGSGDITPQLPLKISLIRK